MFKKILAIATMLCVFPVMAHAWTLGTWVKAQGGTITSPNTVTPQTVLNGSITKSYSTVSETVTITPAAGFMLSKLELNGIISIPNTTVPTVITALPAGPNKVYATFGRVPLSLSATAGANGSVDKASYSPVYAGSQSPAKTFTFSPFPGFAVQSITPSAGTLNVNYQYLDAITNTPVTVPAAVGVKVKVNVVNVPAGTSYTFAATFSGAPPVNSPDANSKACAACHATLGVGVGVYEAFASGPHNNTIYGCKGCHVGADLGQHPGVIADCNSCHGAGQIATPPTTAGLYSPYSAAHATAGNSGNYAAACGVCHAPLAAAPRGHDMGGCVNCHSIPQSEAGKVNDNSGVRAATIEFGKWSHHVTGVELSDAHCAACHLEGKYSATYGGIVIDRTYHRAGTTTHLRNADTDADMVWDPLAPNQSTMDNFCMSCHDANGATSAVSVQIQGFINSVGLAATGKTASASNPFGDTISNRYDKMFRPAVVNVNSQFNTTNNSHHGVKGPRYSGRTRTPGPRAITSAATPAVFAANSTATLYGARSTIYDSVNSFTKVSEFGTNPAFNALYVPLANAAGETAPRTGAATLGDDSTLHCGDCHTVGQWKPLVATNAAGVLNTVAIGAHGSNNEYMLRNDKGTDERHTQDAYVKNTALNVPNPGPNGFITYTNPNGANLVCFNCHSYKRYGSVYNATGATGPHAGEYDASGRCNGVGNSIPFNGYTTGTATDGTQFESRIGEGSLAALSSNPAFAPGFPLNFANAPGGVQAATYTGEQAADFGNVLGIQCLNCHNSGVGNGYGGIHGSANNSPGTANTLAAGGYANPDPAVTGGAFVDGMGNTNKVQRFLPGLGNVMHVPGTFGGFKATVAGPATKAKNAKFGSYSFVTGGISADANWEQIGWKQISGNPTGGATGLGAGCYTLNNEGAGGSLDNPLSATQGLKGQSFDGGATIPNAAKTWGGCDDHVGGAVGGGDHGFYKRINRPVTY